MNNKLININLPLRTATPLVCVWLPAMGDSKSLVCRWIPAKAFSGSSVPDVLPEGDTGGLCLCA
jgi:hypothetical protein